MFPLFIARFPFQRSCTENNSNNNSNNNNDNNNNSSNNNNSNTNSNTTTTTAMLRAWSNGALMVQGSNKRRKARRLSEGATVPQALPERDGLEKAGQWAGSDFWTMWLKNGFKTAFPSLWRELTSPHHRMVKRWRGSSRRKQRERRLPRRWSKHYLTPITSLWLSLCRAEMSCVEECFGAPDRKLW